MSPQEADTFVHKWMDRMFNQGDLSAVDEGLAPGAVDHQEPPGTDFNRHLKQAITALRTAFPDLHFEINHVAANGDMVAFHSTMTGTHLGMMQLPHVPPVPPTGKKVSVQHMHFLRVVDGKGYELWHVWETLIMLRQLGVLPQPQQA